MKELGKLKVRNESSEEIRYGLDDEVQENLELGSEFERLHP